jgi:predicted nucleic acid-binding protein
VLVVSDTSPLHYLILIGRAHILFQLYGRIVVPRAVLAELTVPSAPDLVRGFVAQCPEWLEIHPPAESEPFPGSEELDLGEREAIALSLHLRADLLLIDERAGYRRAAEAGIPVAGLLRVLATAGSSGLLIFLLP